MEDFFFYCTASWKNMQKEKRIHNPFLLLHQKRLGEVKKCAAFGCSNIFYDTEETATGMHFLGFLTDLRN